MSSFENVEVFEDTKKLCETNGKIKEVLARSVKNQKLILEEEALSAVDKARFEDEAKIVVSTKRTSRRLQIMQVRRWRYITLPLPQIRAAV